LEAILSVRIRPGMSVLRYLGPRRRPSMPEMLARPRPVGRGLGESVGLVTDGAFRAAPGAWCRPRRAGAYDGGPIAWYTRAIHSIAPTGACCRSRWRGRIGPARRQPAPPPPRYNAGVLAKFAGWSRPASEGAVTG
jgi:dihydroxy-acid dehydratase